MRQARELSLLLSFTSVLVSTFACGGSSDPVGLTGIRVAATAVDFGPVAVGTTRRRTVAIENIGGEPVRLIAPRPSDDLDPAFFFSLPMRTVEPGAAVELEIAFEPERDGDARGAVFVSIEDDPQAPRRIDLVGRGFAAPLFVVPSELTLPSTVVGTTRTATLALTNRSDASIEVDAVYLANAGTCGQERDALFCLRESFPLSMAPSEQRTLALEFTPRLTDAAEAARFVLRPCAAEGCDVEVRVQGAGVDTGLSCETTRVDYGAVNEGTCVTSQVRCANEANERIQITAIDLETGSSSAFSVAGAAPAEIPPDGDVTIDVEYCPLGATQNRGTLIVSTVAPVAGAEDVRVELVGRGGGANIVATPSSVDVGQVSLLAPVHATVVVRNTGDAALEILQVDVDREGTGALSTQDRGPATLPPDQTYAIQLAIQPSVASLVESSIVIVSNDRDTPELRVPVRAEGVSLAPCRYEISPSSIDLGDVQRGLPVRRSVVVRNIGGDDCLFRSFAITSSQGTLSLDGAPASLRAPAGASTVFFVDYVPRENGNTSGTLSFVVSDPTNPTPSLSITASARDPMQIVYPDALDLGPASSGCSVAAASVRVHNPTEQPITVTGIRLTGTEAGAFALSAPAVPVTLSPSDFVSASVSLAPATFQTRIYAASLEVTAMVGGQARTAVVPLTGRVGQDTRRVERFAAPPSGEVDLLLSMQHVFATQTSRVAITNGLATLFSQAGAAGLDVQAAITTGDLMVENGELLGTPPVVRSSAMTPASTLAGYTSGRPEQGGFQGMGQATFEGAFRGLTAPRTDVDNAGFLRSDARLSLLMVGRMAESSARAVESYADLFMRLEGHHRRHFVSVSAIAGDLPNGCTPGTGMAGPRFFELAARTGGASASWCSTDWPATMAALAPDLLGQRVGYELYGVPDPATIEVRVDGTLVPANGPSGPSWQYDGTSNRVQFTPFSRPALGADVEIAYEQACQ